MASAISLSTVSISYSVSLRKSGWPNVAIPTSISLALKLLETTVDRVFKRSKLTLFSLYSCLDSLKSEL